jgi:hypothetical protein
VQGHAASRLRVLREFEPGSSPACAGRMVITGRMADVCAELERMSQTQRAHLIRESRAGRLHTSSEISGCPPRLPLRLAGTISA